MAEKKEVENTQKAETVSEEEVKAKAKKRKAAGDKNMGDNELTQETDLKEPIEIKEEETSRESDSEKEDSQDQLTSLDILWGHAFRELEHWAEHADYRDEVFLKEAGYFADAIKRNQGNIIAVAEQFNKEFAEWEKTAREEFLMSTTTLQHFFPKVSYEEINQKVDDIQKRTMMIINKPCQLIANNQVMEQYLDLIEQYIAFRKKGRNQYIKAIKQAANLVYESQKGFVELFSGPIKAFMFPFNKYLENRELDTAK